MRPMLYPSELSSGDVPDSNRHFDREVALYLSANVASWNTFSRSRAYATAAPRAPDGLWNPNRCEPFERCSALASRRRSQFVCDRIRLPPVPKHPGTAHEAPTRLSLPRTSTVRMLRGARCNRDKTLEKSLCER